MKVENNNKNQDFQSQTDNLPEDIKKLYGKPIPTYGDPWSSLDRVRYGINEKASYGDDTVSNRAYTIQHVQIPKKLYEENSAPLQAIFVYGILKRHVNNLKGSKYYGLSFIMQDNLSAKYKISKTTIGKCVKWLQNKGFIIVRKEKIYKKHIGKVVSKNIYEFREFPNQTFYSLPMALLDHDVLSLNEKVFLSNIFDLTFLDHDLSKLILRRNAYQIFQIKKTPSKVTISKHLKSITSKNPLPNYLVFDDVLADESSKAIDKKIETRISDLRGENSEYC
ncbi:MAG: hypothetical protein Q8M29_00480 [Bacteroidota bacterium]|nr:hypothetical protein [Bacteroidota bacterium]